MEPILSSVVIGLTTSLVASYFAYKFGYFTSQRLYRKEIDEAPRKYVKNLGRLISEANEKIDNASKEDAVVFARSIIALRDSLRSHMVSISSLLNSEIDRLAEEVNTEQTLIITERHRSSQKQELKIDEIRATIKVLAKIWPAKEDQVQYEIRKIIAELGLGKL